MRTTAIGRGWTCTRCLQQRRLLSTRTAARNAAAGLARAVLPSAPASFRPPDDDQILRDVFDKSSVWKDFQASRAGTRSSGLFGNAHLKSPEGFEHYTSRTLEKCQRLVAKISDCSTEQGYRRIVKDLDRLSDLLCRVIDLCEFVRSSHPDPQYQNAATKAYLTMFQYMNILNTTPQLNEQLQKALAMPEIVNSWSEQEKTVANILARDFSKSAIDLPEGDRQEFVDLSDQASQVGSLFVDTMEAKTSTLTFPSSKLRGMDPMVVRQYTNWGEVSLPVVGGASTLALRTVQDSGVRKEIYMASRTASKETLTSLETLLATRSKLAKLSGFSSFSQMTLSDKMAKSPDAVQKFLNALYMANRPRAKQELDELLALKMAEAQMRDTDLTINAWDRDYYTNKVLTSMEYRARNDHLSSYFSLGTVMQGLSRLFYRLYGIKLVPKETASGETWNGDVRRLDVVDESDGVVAAIYCDLFQRAGKSPNPAHFTVRCSREISQDEVLEAHEHQSPSFPSDLDAANDGFPVGERRTPSGTQHFQLPTIALICDFAIQKSMGRSSSKPALLSFREVQTLFHEMGHAIHSICGRTKLQNVSGTRCATDFAELPSVLMEHFASAPEVLGLYARHWETDAPLDPSLVQERIAVERRMHGAEVEGQILMSLLDQAYHSADITSAHGHIDSTKIYHQIWNSYSGVPEPAGTTWQGFFGHLVGYGATYYAYLFDRVIAGKIWTDVFQRRKGGAIDETAGRVFKEEVLRWGGSRDGWRCVAGALGDRDGVLAEGKEGAMEIVGKWGLKT